MLIYLIGKTAYKGYMASGRVFVKNRFLCAFIFLICLSSKLLIGAPTPTYTPTPGAGSVQSRVEVYPGYVYAIAADNNNLYLGGAFSTVGYRTGKGLPFDPAGGIRIQGFPEVTGGEIAAAVSDGNGGWFIGGNFSAVAGIQMSKLAHIYSNGSLDPAFNINANYEVYSLYYDGTNLYVGGDFSNIGGFPYQYLAKVDPVADTVSASFNPGVTNIVYAIGGDASGIYIGGNFTSVSGTARNYAAKVDAVTGATDMSFNPAPNYTVYSILVKGSGVYMGGGFSSVSGTAREYIAMVDSTTGALDTSFYPKPSSTVYSMAFDDSGGSLYIGGYFNSVSNTAHAYMAKVDPVTGIPDNAFSPVMGASVQSIVYNGSSLYAAGYFKTVNGQPRNYAAKLDAATGALDPSFNPSLNDYTNVVCPGAAGMFFGGNFSMAQCVTRNGLFKVFVPTDSIDPVFNPNASGGGGSVRALAAVPGGGAVYAGGDFNIIGGLSMKYAAKLDPITGSADPAFNPQPDLGLNVLYYDGARSQLIAGGSFTTIGGLQRYRLARLDPLTGAAVASFNAGRIDNYVLSLATDGANIYIGGSISTVNGTAKSGTAKLNAVTGALDPVFSLAVDGSVNSILEDPSGIYVAGDFSNANSLSRRGAARADAVSGAVDVAHDISNGNTGYSLASDGSKIYMGGLFNAIQSQARTNIAAVSSATQLLDSIFNPGADSYVMALAAAPSGNLIYAGGYFENIGGVNSMGYAALWLGLSPTNTSTPFTPSATPTRTIIATPTFTGTFTVTMTSTAMIMPTCTYTPTPGGFFSLIDSVVACGSVNCVTSTASDVYIGGSFSLVGPATGPGVPVNVSTGSIVPGFPRINGGNVNSAISDGNGGWYAGGNFTYAAGISAPMLIHIFSNGALDPVFRLTAAPDMVISLCLDNGSLYYGTYNGLHKVNAITGAADGQFSPGVTGPVTFVFVDSATRIIIGGDFTAIKGSSWYGMAKLDKTTGAADTSFCTAATFNSGVDSACPDGANGLYITGGFTSIAGVYRNRAAKIDRTTCAVDPTFDPNLDNAASYIYYDGAWVYIYGSFWSSNNGAYVYPDFIKVNPSTGAVNPAFKPQLGVSYFDTVLLSGGNLYVAGGLPGAAGNSRAVVKMDTTTGAIVTVFNVMADNDITALAADGTGTNVFVGGYFITLACQYRKGLAKINLSTGALDPVFKPEVDGGNVQSISYDPTSLYFGGSFTSVSTTPRSGLAKVNLATGALDTTFVPPANYGGVNKIAYDPSTGSLFSAGYFTPTPAPAAGNYINKFNAATGALDTTFSANSNGGVGLLLTSPGSIYVGGTFSSMGGKQRSGMAKLDPVSGAVDLNFDPDLGTYYHDPSSMCFDGNGNIFLSGEFSMVYDIYRSYMAKINHISGAPDMSFNPNGQDNNSSNVIFDGVNMYYSDNTAIKRINGTTGAADSTFNESVTGGGISDMKLTLPGSVLCVGGSFSSYLNMPANNFLMMYLGPPPVPSPTFTTTPTPTVTITFVTTPTFTYTPGVYKLIGSMCTDGIVYAITSTASNVYIGGLFNRVGVRSEYGVIVSPSDGSITAPSEIIGGQVNASVPDGSGGWYIAGLFSGVSAAPHAMVAHILSSGKADQNFNVTLTSFGNGANALLLQGGSLYIGGTFYTVNGTAKSYMAKVSAADGSLDTAFDSGSWGNINAITTDGTSLYIGGDFTHAGGMTLNRLAKLNPATGAADPAFNPGADGTVNTLIYSAANNCLYAGGSFLNIGGVALKYAAKLGTASGAVDTAFNAYVNNTVNDILEAAGSIYLSGSFQDVSGYVRRSVAKVNPLTGALDTSFNANADSYSITALSYDGTNLYIGGTFNDAGGYPVVNAAKLNPASGAVIQAFNTYANGAVNTLSCAYGRIFEGGNFIFAGGVARRNLAKLAYDGSSVDTAFTADTDNVVMTLGYMGQYLYVGGSFMNICSMALPCLARVSLSNGALDPYFTPRVEGPSVNALDFNSTENSMFIGGYFSTVNWLPCSNIAKVSAVTGSLDPLFSCSANYTVNSLIYNSARNSLYLGGSFTSVSGTAVSEIAKVNADTGVPDALFSPQTINGSVNAVLSDGTWLYFGGNFTSVGSQARNYVAMVDMNGASLSASFNPNVNGTVQCLEYDGAYIYMGGTFSMLGGMQRNGIGRVLASNGALDTIFNPNANSIVYRVALSAKKDILHAGGNFTSMSSMPASYYAPVYLFGTPPSLTSTPTITPTSTITQTKTASPTRTQSATFTATRTITMTRTPTSTQTNTGTQTQVCSPTCTPTITETFTISPTFTISETFTISPTVTETSTYASPTYTRTSTATPSSTMTATGTYTVTRTVSPTPTYTPSFTPTPTFTQTVVPVSQAQKDQVLLYPVPAAGSLNVSIKDSMGAEAVRVEIYTVKFRLVRRLDYAVNPLNIYNVVTSDFSNGTFILRVKLVKDGTTVYKKTLPFVVLR
jgi:hypothetical protein